MHPDATDLLATIQQALHREDRLHVAGEPGPRRFVEGVALSKRRLVEAHDIHEQMLKLAVRSSIPPAVANGAVVIDLAAARRDRRGR